MKNIDELKGIIKEFADCGWDLIDGPAKAWLEAVDNETLTAEVTNLLIKAVEAADEDCGSCGCSFDPLYKRALELLKV